MTESEFLHLSDTIFAYIEACLDALSDDFDCQISGNILTIEHISGGCIVVNRHLASMELWLASPSGGHHFALKDDIWYSERDQADLFTLLKHALSTVAGNDIAIGPYREN